MWQPQILVATIKNSKIFGLRSNMIKKNMNIRFGNLENVSEK